MTGPPKRPASPPSSSAEGVRNVLVVTGDAPEVRDYPCASGVYQVDSIGLVEIMGHLNRHEDHNGRTTDAPISFLPGSP